MGTPELWFAAVMPGQWKTRARNVRVEDDLWDAAKQAATERGDNLSEQIRKFLRSYVEQHKGGTR